MQFHEGAGVESVAWLAMFEAALSDADFRDGQREFAEFEIGSKEELFLIRTLAAKMDVRRVPHLRGRPRLRMPCARRPRLVRAQCLAGRAGFRRPVQAAPQRLVSA